MATHLVRYEAALVAVREARDVDEVKDIRDKAQAMAAYAEQAKDTSLLEWATEIKVRAERRAGEMLAEMKVNGTRHNGRNLALDSHDTTPAPTLETLGISKDQSARWQKLAKIPEESFDEAVTAAKELSGKVTTAAMLRAAKSKKPAAAKKSKLVVIDGSSKEEPAPPATVPLAQYEALQAEHRKLRERYEALDATLEEMAERLDTYESISKGQAVEDMHTLRRQLAQANRARDDAMREAAGMIGKIEALKGELKKLRSTGFKK